MLKRKLAITPILCASISLFGATAPVQSKTEGVTVPFVGCESDGQIGPQVAPRENSPVLKIPAKTAQRLAYYKAEDGPGVLGPRGWHCFGIYGSNGSTLFVAPEPINRTRFFEGKWKGFTGSVIQISLMYGDTSGRFSVAKIIARVFPAYRAFVKRVIAEGIEPASSFPSGAYPHDKLVYRSKRIVEFETPANTIGLGTTSWIVKGDRSIRGMAILTGEEPNLVQLSLRLPTVLEDLAPTVIQQAEEGTN